MDIKRKLEIAESAIRSITTHDDEDSSVRLQAVVKLKDFLDSEVVQIHKRLQVRAGKFRKTDSDSPE
jgi:hypothetical protein